MTVPTAPRRPPVDRRIDTVRTVAQAQSNLRIRQRAAIVGVLGLTLVVTAYAMRTSPRGISPALLIFVLALVAVLVWPVSGVYLIVVTTLVGDMNTQGWWPVTKNLSSAESVLYLADQLVMTPVEILIVFTAFSWLLRTTQDPNVRFRDGVIVVPMAIVFGFVIFGLLWGKARGGDTRAAIYEVRGLLWMPPVYLLITNLFDRRVQYLRLLWMSCVAVAVQTLFAIGYFRSLDADERERLTDLAEHPATVVMNVVLLVVLALFLLRGAARLRWGLLLAVPCILYVYVLSQRRSAMVALGVGIALLTVLVIRRRRVLGTIFAGTTTVLVGGLIAATWNVQGGAGVAAQAFKSVIGSESQSVEDRASDMYRLIENYDLWFTIRANPITGIGFGNRFYKPIALPDISFFEFWEHISHNSVLWLWLKLGFFGFVAVWFLFGRAIQHGSRAMFSLRDATDVVAVYAGVVYLIMFLVFSYVDIAWDLRSGIFLGLAFALACDYARAAPVPVAGPMPRLMPEELAARQ